jgi:hypothetical protein
MTDSSSLSSNGGGPDRRPSTEIPVRRASNEIVEPLGQGEIVEPLRDGDVQILVVIEQEQPQQVTRWQAGWLGAVVFWIVVAVILIAAL